jgi:hypothetical protein
MRTTWLALPSRVLSQATADGRGAQRAVRCHNEPEPGPLSGEIQVPSPRTMDPDVDADFERRFRDA